MPTYAAYTADGDITAIHKVPPEVTDLGLAEGEFQLEVPPDTTAYDRIEDGVVIKQDAPPPPMSFKEAKAKEMADAGAELPTINGSWNEEYMRAMIYQVMEEMRDSEV